MLELHFRKAQVNCEQRGTSMRRALQGSRQHRLVKLTRAFIDDLSLLRIVRQPFQLPNTIDNIKMKYFFNQHAPANLTTNR
jgi:hypothetical protein